MDRRIAAVLAVLMIVGGVAVAVSLAGPDARTYDLDVAQFFINQRTQTLNTVMSAVTFFGSAWALAPLTVLGAVLLALRRRGGAALLLLGAMTTSWTLTNSLKSAVGRSRPDTVDLIGTVSDSGAFPSGHTLNSAVFLAVAAGIALTPFRAGAVRAPTVVVALVAGVAIGVSRIYLGYHWLSDVLGGWAVASAIVGATWLLVIVWAKPRGHPPS